MADLKYQPVPHDHGAFLKKAYPFFGDPKKVCQGSRLSPGNQAGSRILRHQEEDKGTYGKRWSLSRGRTLAFNKKAAHGPELKNVAGYLLLVTR